MFITLWQRYVLADVRQLVFILLSLAGVSMLWRSRPKEVRRVQFVPVVGVQDSRDIPAARRRFRPSAQDILMEGYMTHKGKPFYVPSPLGERLMLPPQYVEQLRNESDDVVDFVGTFFEMFEGRYTTMGSRASLHPRVARVQLNRNMDQVLGPLQDEVRLAFEELMPVSDEWTSVNISDVILKVTARASSRMFGGTKLSTHGPWLQAMLDFASDGFFGAQKIKQWPRYLRPLASLFISELWGIKKHYKIAREAIVPLLKSRQTGATKKSSDFLQWMLEDAKDEEADFEFIADIQLKMSFAALHTSAATPVQLMYDLCSMPEYIEPLRQEIKEVVPAEKPCEKRTLMSLPKLESFMKESQRLNPLLLETFERIILRDYTLADGFVIPAGTQVGVPAHAMGMDPTVYPDPSKFDGFRTYRIREKAHGSESMGRTQWAASNLSNMAFGYGKHACPGRYFADFEIKVIMIHLLTAYDFRFEGENSPRPANFMVETQMIPDHQTTILVRKRQ